MFRRVLTLDELIELARAEGVDLDRDVTTIENAMDRIAARLAKKLKVKPGMAYLDGKEFTTDFVQMFPMQDCPAVLDREEWRGE